MAYGHNYREGPSPSRSRENSNSRDVRRPARPSQERSADQQRATHFHSTRFLTLYSIVQNHLQARLRPQFNSKGFNGDSGESGEEVHFRLLAIAIAYYRLAIADDWSPPPPLGFFVLVAFCSNPTVQSPAKLRTSSFCCVSANQFITCDQVAAG
jgi:hypothetical protein